MVGGNGWACRAVVVVLVCVLLAMGAAASSSDGGNVPSSRPSEAERIEREYAEWLDRSLRVYVMLKRNALLPEIQYGTFGRGLYARSPHIPGRPLCSHRQD